MSECRKLFRRFNNGLNIVAGIGAITWLTGEYGLYGFVTAWVLMQFGAQWRPPVERWLNQSEEQSV